jgi:hypothetical protein
MNQTYRYPSKNGRLSTEPARHRQRHLDPYTQTTMPPRETALAAQSHPRPPTIDQAHLSLYKLGNLSGSHPSPSFAPSPLLFHLPELTDTSPWRGSQQGARDRRVDQRWRGRRLPSTRLFSFALSGSLAHRHHPDLTPSLLDPGNVVDHRQRRPSPELTGGKSSTTSRAPTPLHARPLAKNTLRNRSATDLVTDDHRSPLGKLASARNPSPPAPPRMHAMSRGEERPRAVGS